MTEEETQEPRASGETADSATRPKTPAKKTARKTPAKKTARKRSKSGDKTQNTDRAPADTPEPLPGKSAPSEVESKPDSDSGGRVASADDQSGKRKPVVDEVPVRYSSDEDPELLSGNDRESSRPTDANESENDRSEYAEPRDSALRHEQRGYGQTPEQSERRYAEGNADAGDNRPHRGDGHSHGGNRPQQRQGGQGGWKQKNKNFKQRFKKQQPGNSQQPQPQGGPSKKKKKRKSRQRDSFFGPDAGPQIQIGFLGEYELLEDFDQMNRIAEEHSSGEEPVSINELAGMPLLELADLARNEFEIEQETAPKRQTLIEDILEKAFSTHRAITVQGVVETTEEGYGLLVYQNDNYKIRPLNTFVSEALMQRYGLKRGHLVEGRVHPSRDGETCPYLLRVDAIMDESPEENLSITPFEDLVPYYPTNRLILETSNDVSWDNLSMRIVDLLTPIGQGQRGLIVAPPRTGKTVLQQGIANAIITNYPEVHLIVLLVDERPEEVTDFRRQVKAGEVIASTFDQDAESHVHCAEMVIEKARRLVERGQHVAILLDSITRLARAYNALASNSGKILSGGVEANALQKPKRFFGSARNIEGAGSLTILGTALIETGSRMDEVIFEEFKGTGNMELHLDRALVDKRIFPAIGLDRSGTRKEELLYHPDEMQKVFGLRRAMKGVPSPEAMEMLIGRVKKTKTNVEFLMGLNR